MAAKTKNAKKLPKLDSTGAPDKYRRQHTPFTCEILTPPSAPIVARHRARTVLTPLAVRRAIIEDAASNPEPVRLRSLRRRLTALDRALPDREAAALDRLTSCITSLSNIGCLNYLKSEVRSSHTGRLPFNESKRIEIAAANAVLKGLSPAHKAAVLELAVLLDPGHGTFCKLAGEFIALLQSAATATAAIYDEWFRQYNRAPLGAVPRGANNLRAP